jgi:hypothetical protein
MVINPKYIKNWNGIGCPPEIAFEQFAYLWHIELVIRHFVYAATRLTYGNKNWQSVLEEVRAPQKESKESKEPQKGKCTLLEELQRRANNSIKNGEFTEKTVPDEIWFTNTKELIDIICNRTNWKNCFSNHIGDVTDRNELNKQLSSLSDQRNRWAHFRPLAPTESKLKDIIAYLERPFSNWCAYKYWNSAPVSKKHEIFGLYAKKCDGGIPITCDTYGIFGFLDKSKSLDRGLSILIKQNDASTCWWAEIVNVGGNYAACVEVIHKLGIILRESAIHISVKYDPYTAKETISKEAINGVEVSFPIQAGIENFLEGLLNINRCLAEYSLKYKRNKTEDNETTSTDMTNLLFYNTPFNVIISPIQEHIRYFHIQKEEK